MAYKNDKTNISEQEACCNLDEKLTEAKVISMQTDDGQNYNEDKSKGIKPWLPAISSFYC